jgi:osmotically-inducible protein OsmY
LNEIRVQTLNHEVFLSGLVSSGLAIEEATVVASSVPGVSGVLNSIVVSN